MRATAGADVRMQRIARHGFADRPASSVADAARLIGGLQAQDPQASRLGVRSRAQDLTEADVLRAIEVERSVVRTWLMRATIHLVAAVGRVRHRHRHRGSGRQVRPVTHAQSG